MLTEREKELASLVQVLRDTLADLAGQAKTFNVDLMKTTDRINGLANIDDIRELKRRIASEAKELKNVVVEKQRRDDVLFMQLSRRVDALQSQLAEAQSEAEEDPLTGVANRRGFDRALREWTAIAEPHKKPFLLAMVEIDDFKTISEKHGHQVGDRVLLCVAQRLRREAGDKDIVARFGAESFAVLIRQATSIKPRSGSRRRSRRWPHSSTSTSTRAGGDDLVHVLRGGVTEFNPGETADELVKRADRALADARVPAAARWSRASGDASASSTGRRSAGGSRVLHAAPACASAHRQRNSLHRQARRSPRPQRGSASRSRGDGADAAPSSITPRSASFSAVSGSARMNGCAASGKFDDEKNTPESSHIGSITTFISPDTASMVRGARRDQQPEPRERKRAEQRQRRHQPQRARPTSRRTPASPNTSSAATSSTRNTEPRQQVREQVVAAPHRRRHQALEQLARARLTIEKPMPHRPVPMMFMPSRPGISQSM